MTNESIDAFRQQLTSQVRTLQIIVTALVLGCVFFLGVVWFLFTDGGPQAANQANQAGLPLPVVLGVVVLLVVARLIVPRALATASIRKIAEAVGTLRNLHQRQRPSNIRSWINTATWLGCGTST